MIGDDVEIGAEYTIDRGALDDTVLEDGVKLDNQIQVAHNVRIGAQLPSPPVWASRAAHRQPLHARRRRHHPRPPTRWRTTSRVRRHLGRQIPRPARHLHGDYPFWTRDRAAEISPGCGTSRPWP